MEWQSGNETEILKKMQQIYEEREKEFQKREETYNQKKQQLNGLLEDISKRNKELEIRKSEMERTQSELETQKQSLAVLKDDLEEKEAAQKQKELQLETQQKELVMKHQLELESVRNEKLHLERLSEEYEHKITFIDAGIVPLLNEESGSKEINLDAYILKKEHEDIIKQQREALEHLKEENTSLIRSVTKLQADREAVENAPDQSAAPKETEQPALVEDVPKQPVQEEVLEDLTAEVLKNYLEKNESDFQELEIRHADDGDQLVSKRKGLDYRFVFASPAYCDIMAQRKDNSRIKKVLLEMNQKYPGVQFRYDDGKVYATSFFLPNMKAYKLMQRIKGIADEFNEEK